MADERDEEARRAEAEPAGRPLPAYLWASEPRERKAGAAVLAGVATLLVGQGAVLGGAELLGPSVSARVPGWLPSLAWLEWLVTWGAFLGYHGLPPGPRARALGVSRPPRGVGCTWALGTAALLYAMTFTPRGVFVLALVGFVPVAYLARIVARRERTLVTLWTAAALCLSGPALFLVAWYPPW